MTFNSLRIRDGNKMKRKIKQWRLPANRLRAAAVLVCIQAASSSFSGAIEISLEENRGERGSVGYVDIERVFKEYPETLKAREDFQVQIHKKEKVLNEKKSEIFALKAEIARLRQEKEFSSRFPMRMEQAPPAVSTAAAAAVPDSAPVQEASGAVFSTAAAVEQEGSAAAVSTQSASGLPGISTAAASMEASTATVDISSRPVPEAEKSATQTVMDLPGVKSVPVSSLPVAVSTATAELDMTIRDKENELAQKEKLLNELQRQVERELLDYESRKTEIILGKIYQFLRSLAASQGISVVVDKRSILYGQSGVDLTDKLIKRLRKFY